MMARTDSGNSVVFALRCSLHCNLQNFQNTGEPIAAETPGRALAVEAILDDLSQYQLIAGSTAQVATYTEYGHHFDILRRVLLRMKSCLNYVFTEGP